MIIKYKQQYKQNLYDNNKIFGEKFKIFIISNEV